MINILKFLVRFILRMYINLTTSSKIKRKCLLNFNTYLEGNNVVNCNVHISDSKLGYGTYIGENSRLMNCCIGKYCSISENVKIIIGSHPTHTFVSTHPAFFSTKKQAGFTYVENNLFNESKLVDDRFHVIIGNDVWIGSNVLILEGSIIGDGAIVATGAVVRGKLEPYGIYGGVPAKKIGERFSLEEKEFLIDFKWWDNKENWIKDNSLLFTDIKSFMKKLNVTN